MPVVRQIAQLGRPVLREVAELIDDPYAPRIQSLIDDMLVTVDDAGGVGIAAPQVYESLSLFIVCPRPNIRYPDAPYIDPMVMINPEILWRSDDMENEWEGCLSIPGIRGLVPRHRTIGVRFVSRSGEILEAELEGFIARVFQHEYDHVQGMLFVDRSDSRDLATEKEYGRILTAKAGG